MGVTIETETEGLAASAAVSLPWAARVGTRAHPLRDALSLLRAAGRRVWLPYDALVGGAAALLGYYLSPSFSFARPAVPAPVVVIPAFAALLAAGGAITGLWEDRCFRSRPVLVVRAASSVVLAWAVLLAGAYLLAFSTVGRWIVLISSGAALGGLAAPRLLLSAGAHAARQRVLLLAGEAGTVEMRSFLRECPGSFQLVCPALVASPAREDAARAGGGCGRPPLLAASRATGADVIVIDGMPDAALSSLEVEECLSAGLEVVDAATFAEECLCRVPARTIGMEWLISAHVRLCRPSLCALKRVCDVVAALVGLIVTLPLWPLVAVLIKATSRGPVFYLQTRVGRFGRPFRICKFRTMRQDAERDAGPTWASDGDPRVTPVGRLLRKTRIDEIPQFWNILVGDMSLVGPRPERPEFVERLAPKMPSYRWRHIVRPGATGWAQINFGYGASEQDAWEKLSYDLFYVKHFSFALDAYVCLRTLATIVCGSR